MAPTPGRTLAVVAATAVVSLGAGLALSHLIVSPAEAAAQAAPPEAGPITVPVEERTLSNEVVLRGDAIYEDPLDVTIETGDLGGPAVVTGQVPEVGSTIEAGSVILEVTGRPVILLGGDLPVYRTLRAGGSGPDVRQLKEALAALGLDAGDPATGYDAQTAAAVRALYERVGYPAPAAGDEADAAADAAADEVRAAEQQVSAAQRELDAAGSGLGEPERVRLQAAVDTAQARLDEATTACSADPDACLNSEVVAARGDLDAARADLAAAQAPADVAAQRAALDEAQRGLATARSRLSDARLAELTPLPASEIVYLPATPRRVDAVSVQRGAIVAGTPVMSVSGATLQIEGMVADTDAALVVEGSDVAIALPGGDEVPGTVQTVGGGADAAAEAGRTRVVVVPGELTEDQRQELQGANVRITVPVSATDGEVLAVPAAALTAGPGGEARVEVAHGSSTTLVTVATGLAADGFVEVSATGDGSLAAGDLVVVGTGAGTAGDDTTSDEG
ncbi:hypothetical protein OEB99_13990 [Actinotalea sp. M2MS4P-6]|uniref:peptidoglycan-binding protein n=1 Tax=Actinotalea sp. M2MS4P-6 TaxID=2983762 RepID=UPI0021E448FA|nr:peptidoglycan-binding protein [Actinotalea sp. M2MS4P-6]MCV2395423.1 hypothetical protein [Actinotalea sp. M2MS4P-6]